MKRFILSASSVLLATAAVAPTAQALPKVDPSFELQGLRLQELDTRNKGVSASFELQKIRLQEFDTRNKSEDYSQPYYPQTPSQASAESTTYDAGTQWEAQPESQTESQTESQWENQWETAEEAEESSTSVASITQRRQASLDRN